jgi:hypothetical protein
VSLLRDAYVTWPEASVRRWVLQYKEKIKTIAPVSDETFLRWFDLMGLQRHLKAILTFSRKYRRDHNSNYLQHIPRTLNYVVTEASRHAECESFSYFLNDVILPVWHKVSLSCAQ